MSTRRRRDKRRRQWVVFKKKTMWYSFSNVDTILADGTVKGGIRFEAWSGWWVKLHG